MLRNLLLASIYFGRPSFHPRSALCTIAGTGWRIRCVVFGGVHRLHLYHYPAMSYQSLFVTPSYYNMYTALLHSLYSIRKRIAGCEIVRLRYSGIGNTKLILASKHSTHSGEMAVAAVIS
jgi:hypothetical protein